MFRKDHMFMDAGGDLAQGSSDNQTCSEQVELEFHNVLTHQQSELEADQKEQEQVVHDDLHDYQLARDRMKRQIKAPARYAHAEVASFALNIAEEIGNS